MIISHSHIYVILETNDINAFYCLLAFNDTIINHIFTICRLTPLVQKYLNLFRTLGSPVHHFLLLSWRVYLKRSISME